MAAFDLDGDCAFLVNDERDVIEFDPEPLAQDLYGVAISSVLRDSRRIALGEDTLLRSSRILTTMLLLSGTLCMQSFLVYHFKRLITANSVHNSREAYDAYEKVMYEGHTFKTVNGYDRGQDGYLNPERLKDLDIDIKMQVCSIPLSQPCCFACILSIWTFTVVSDVRRLWFVCILLLVKTPTCENLKDMLVFTGHGRTVSLEGIPLCLKIFIFSFMFLPRLIVDGILLWLGCRWLVATDAITDVILNAMALEFILLLKNLLYTAVVPLRDKFDTTKLIVPIKHKDPPTYTSFLGSFLWIIVVITWVVAYMYCLQTVLPDYRWDVHDICEMFIAESTQV